MNVLSSNWERGNLTIFIKFDPIIFMFEVVLTKYYREREKEREGGKEKEKEKKRESVCVWGGEGERGGRINEKVFAVEF